MAPSRSFPKHLLRPFSSTVLPLVSGFAALTAFLSTLAPSISWAHGSSDSGELATAAYYLGVAHPTGYPLYVLLGWLFTRLPVGTVAYRLNLLSACAAALTVVLLTLVLLELLRHRPPFQGSLAAAGAPLLLAFSPMFWSQAVVTEVYALNALFVALLLFALAKASAEWPHRALAPAGLGLGLANHVTIVLMLPSLLLGLAPRFRAGAPTARTALGLLAIGVGVGTALYLLLPLRSAAAPPYASWGDLRTPADLAAHVTGSTYRDALFSLPLEAVLLKLPVVARLLLDQFGWAGYLLIVMGCWSMFQERRLFSAAWCLAALLYLLFALEYAVLDSQLYLMPFFLLLAVPAGFGIASLAALAPARAGSMPRWAPFASALPVVALVLLSLVGNWARMDMSQNWGAYNYSRDTLDTLPEKSLVFTREDRNTFSLWYVQYVEGYRPDVAIVDARLLSWPWYRRNLARTYPDLAVPQSNEVVIDYVTPMVAANRAVRPLFFTYADPRFPSEGEGTLRRVTGK